MYSQHIRTNLELLYPHFEVLQLTNSLSDVHSSMEVEWSHENQAMQAAITTNGFSSLPKHVAGAKVSQTTCIIYY